MTPNPILSRLGLTADQVAATAARFSTAPIFVEEPIASRRVIRPAARLSTEKVIRIRELAAQSDPKIPLARIALEFGLSMPATSRVIRGETYHDIGGPISRRNIVCRYEGKRMFKPHEVVAIREEHHFRKVRICDIARREEVPWDTIACIVYGRTYKDCGGPTARAKKGNR